MYAEPQIDLKIASTPWQSPLRAFGLVLLCLLVVIGIFHQSFAEMVSLWGQSQSYTHGFLVLPMFLYFVWRRRDVLAVTPIRRFLPALVLAIGAGFVWLLGELASAFTPSFFAIVALIPLTVTAVLGWRWARVLMFPLALLFFAVPFGDLFVPTLMKWTADFTVVALQVSGVPVYREGQNFVIPSGSWSVVEACSGIRYLIVSMFAGALYAWLMYRSPLRRGLFFLASIAVPIVANWMRAYLIVMLGHISDNRIAADVDHLIYGWIFFGVVMMIMFSVGAIWREDEVSTNVAAAPAPWPASAGSLASTPSQFARAAALTLVALLVWPVAASVLMHALPDRLPPAANIVEVAGWKRVDEPVTDWQPKLQGPAREQRYVFEKDGQRVGLFLGIYRAQRQGAELVSSLNQLVESSSKHWLTLASGTRRAELSGRPLTVRVETLRGKHGTIVAWRWYWLGSVSTSSDLLAKFELALDRLLRRDDTSAWVTIFLIDPESPATADQTLAAFVGDMGGALERGLREMAAR